VVVSLGYFSFLDGGATGQTMGKMAVGIAVRDIDTAGPIGAGRALLRRFLFFAAYFGLILFIINALSPLWDRRRQAWHDKIVRSCVVSPLIRTSTRHPTTHRPTRRGDTGGVPVIDLNADVGEEATAPTATVPCSMS
jgi:uncharacterized RDD family membrane protein YckC